MLPILKGITKGSPRRGERNRYLMPVALLVMLFLIGQVFWLSSNRHLFSPFAIQRILCPACAKSGTVRDPENNRIVTMCPACFGVGYNTIRFFDEMDAVCAACGGIGRLSDEADWRTCQRCDGRGAHRANDWQRIMPVEPVE
jgi:hypothetical protein